MILTPAHGALPSGHATEAFMQGLVLLRLMQSSGNTAYAQPIWAIQLMQLAARIAINRQVAGVHTPVESAAGATLGLALGQYLVDRCDGSVTTYRAWLFDGNDYPAREDFDWSKFYDVEAAKQSGTDYVRELADAAPQLGAPSAVLTWLWRKAAAEWA